MQAILTVIFFNRAFAECSRRMLPNILWRFSEEVLLHPDLLAWRLDEEGWMRAARIME